MSSASTDDRARGEVAALIAIQGAVADAPGVLPAARGLSHLGEHALGWLVAAGVGFSVATVRGDEAARVRWAQAGIGAFGAHAASVVVKRVVRRRRPHDPRIRVGVGTPSRLSFPSSHATSTTAAAILLGRAAGLPPAALPGVLVPPMVASRLVLGVHYPSDVAAGALLGAVCAAAVARDDRLTARAIAQLDAAGRALRGRGPIRGER
ncbi:phosphatase PAP2 family protein [Williamsia deligens]|uniref:Phosphatase PAP2 family protein n=1 Tax=Williamsia deligens TaxID=321325 RepID=A0ABW3G4X7_9NOCA|nr:phosphatase PAP2 family protein [Williamsia deligens]MCP2193953.1 5'-phosphoribosyl-monophospho-decaprenol phosphatase [Williamsia deligens]